MAVGGALIGGGVADADYSAVAKHVNASKFVQVDVAATVATAEIEAGILLTTESGGLGEAMGTGALTGAGVAGYANVLKQVNTNPDGKFDWASFGIAEGTGAIAGAVTGGVSYGIGSLLGVVGGDAGASATEAAVDDVASGASDAGSDISSTGAENGDDALSSRQVFVRKLAAKTTGRFVGATTGEVFNYGMTAWYKGTKVNAGQWALDSLAVGGEQAASQFATGLVFGGYTPTSDTAKFAYRMLDPEIRSGLSVAWATLVKLP
jgi:hypothetical protein